MLNELFGEVISMYTRKEAIADGSLVDVSTLAKEAGIKYPVAITQTAYGEVVRPDEQAKNRGESETGRLWDVLNMFRLKARSCTGSRFDFKVIATEDGREVVHLLYAVCGPGDNAEPVITIMLPNED